MSSGFSQFIVLEQNIAKDSNVKHRKKIKINSLIKKIVVKSL